MMHSWSDDAFWQDIPPALVGLLEAIDAARFDIRQLNAADLLAIADARRAAIRALDLGGIKYPAAVTDASGRLIAPPQPTTPARPSGPWDGNGKVEP